MRKLFLPCLSLLTLAACDSALDRLAPDMGAPASAIVVDGAHGGLEGFYFLPPMVKEPAFTGTFDPDHAPEVEICPATGCGGLLHARYTMDDGVGSERVRLDVEDEHYLVNWHSDGTGAEPGATYRVRIRVGDAVLGYADVHVVATGRDAVAVRSDGSVALVAGQTLPVRFRIETGILAEPPSSSWHPLGDGVDGRVFALLSHGDDLIVAGDFGEAGEVPVGNIARWNGIGWTDLGGGTDDLVLALALYDGDLIAGGRFSTAGGQPASRVARWDGSQWHPIGDGIPGIDVRTIVEFEGQLVVGGQFDEVGGRPASGVAFWDGAAWHPMGSWAAGELGAVNRLAVHQGRLYAGGYHSSQQLAPMYEWDGTDWVDAQVPAHPESGDPTIVVYDLLSHGQDLLVAGNIPVGMTGMPFPLYRFGDSGWSTLGPDVRGFIRSVIQLGDDIVVGGDFTLAGETETNRTALWDGDRWNAMGNGMNAGVVALTIHGGDLIAGGFFTEADGRPASRIARWGLPR